MVPPSQAESSTPVLCVVARFDELLTTVHLIHADTVRCPRGVLVTTPLGRRELGSYRSVQPCALLSGHVGECEPTERLPASATVCGLETHTAPWVAATPSDAARCLECFGLPAPVEDGFDFGGAA